MQEIKAQQKHSRSSDDENEAFLYNQNGLFPVVKPTLPRASIVISVIFILALYTGLIMTLTQEIFYVEKKCFQDLQIVPNIAEDAIQLQAKVFESYDQPDHPFFGTPSDTLDKNWRDLLHWSEIRVPTSEIQRLGREYNSVRFPDGDFMGMPTVYHHLHCLKRLHHHMYLDHYFHVLTDREQFLEREHNTHCLDLIKNAIMCQGDMTILTMRWTNTSPMPAANWSTPHTCVDWSRLQNWTRDHWVDARLPGMLVHPKFGPVLDENGVSRGSRIGVD